MAVIFPRLGPYHIARLRAAAERFDIVAIELSATDSLHAWEPHDGELPFERVTLFESTAAQTESAQVSALQRALEHAGADAVAVNGWAEPTSLAALEWCLDRHVPTIVMSESSAEDAPRVWWRELVKRRILSKFSAALVGGRSHARYLDSLGMAKQQIALGYDAVDNEYFARKSAAARENARELRERLDLPQRYFLASARFVPRKNLAALIQAFARAQQENPTDWGVRILGVGPLMSDLVQLSEQLGVAEAVQFPGFVQYDELPSYYGLASVFVHPSLSEQWGLVVNEAMACGLPVLVSNRCGCAEELVHCGTNGFQFCPEEVESLANLMINSMNQGPELTTMGGQSRKIIANWGSGRFAKGLESAFMKANAATVRLSRLDRLFFRHVRRRRLESSWFSSAVM